MKVFVVSASGCEQVRFLNAREYETPRTVCFTRERVTHVAYLRVCFSLPQCGSLQQTYLRTELPGEAGARHRSDQPTAAETATFLQANQPYDSMPLDTARALQEPKSSLRRLAAPPLAHRTEVRRV
jgi:hypothetical protein